MGKKKNHFKNKNKTTRPRKNTSENSQTHSLGSLGGLDESIENDIFSRSRKLTWLIKDKSKINQG